MKYRIWDKRQQKYFKQGEWETFIWVDHDGKPFEMNITVHGCWLNPKDVSEEYEVEWLVYSPCPEKEIYDNDIIRIMESSCTETNVFITKSSYIQNRPIKYSSWSVIGNKHENKELWESL